MAVACIDHFFSFTDSCLHGHLLNEPHRDKTNKMAYAPSEDSDLPGHPLSLIRVFAVGSVGS